MSDNDIDKRHSGGGRVAFSPENNTDWKALAAITVILLLVVDTAPDLSQFRLSRHSRNISF
jgi:hypothetical protein